MSTEEWIEVSVSIPRTCQTVFCVSLPPPYFRSDDQLEVQDISDSEASSSAVLPSFSRIQSRLNPVPESLNSPDIAPGKVVKKLGRIDEDNLEYCFALPELIRTWMAAKLSFFEIPSASVLNIIRNIIDKRRQMSMLFEMLFIFAIITLTIILC